MKPREQRIATSVLVVGSGGSGLRAAIQVAERGADVLIVGKRPAIDAHTTLAAGGINAALGTMDPEDSWRQHAADTLKESYFLADPQTVQIVAEGAARGIADLERWGMPFAREADGRISHRFFGAHTFRRTAFAGDYTGLEIQRTLLNRARRLRVPIIDTMYVTRILARDGVAFGAYGFDSQTGTRYVVHADAVILAAGGNTRTWRRSSSRRDENTGDAFRLALQAGGRIRDPELVQFHPSGLLEPEEAAGTLVSEAARGEGGVLRNGLGERFMQRYDPARLELSTRDRVALAVYTEIKEGRGTANGGVWLDVSHLPRQTIMQRLPRVYRTLLDLQLRDITTTPIEIAPTAHYSMGGVWVRPEDHGTGVQIRAAIEVRHRPSLPPDLLPADAPDADLAGAQYRLDLQPVRLRRHRGAAGAPDRSRASVVPAGGLPHRGPDRRPMGARRDGGRGGGSRGRDGEVVEAEEAGDPQPSHPG
jgi:succinate dehydrogenase / fumarate reductase flavoprotein subunit